MEMNKNSQMMKAFDFYAETLLKVERSTLYFTFQGLLLDPEMTVEMIGLKEDDIVECCVLLL